MLSFISRWLVYTASEPLLDTCSLHSLADLICTCMRTVHLLLPAATPGEAA
jgi:hypothetical protein